MLPKTIGVVTAESGAARRDLLAGLGRRGWGGTVVWAFAPVQDRHAAPAIAAAIQDLAARPEVEAIVLTRGGGSLADLWAFCDETLCRTVAMLRVPVVSAIGHERDATLIDDVAAVACSTPTHAAEAAVPLDCVAARGELDRALASLRRAAGAAVDARTPHLAALARGPGRALRRERLALNQKTREIRAASERGLAGRLSYQRRLALVVLERARRRAAGPEMDSRRDSLREVEVALRAHEPERTLERGYALAETVEGAAARPAPPRRAPPRRLVCASPMAESEQDQSNPAEVESYEVAVERLEQIIDRLDSGQAGLRETLDLCREGRELVAYCAAELDAVGEGPQGAEAGRAGGEAGAGPEHSRQAPGSRRRAPSCAPRARRSGTRPRTIRSIAAASRSRAGLELGGAETEIDRIARGARGRRRRPRPRGAAAGLGHGEGVDLALDLVVGGALGRLGTVEAVGLVVDDEWCRALALDQQVDRAAQDRAGDARAGSAPRRGPRPDPRRFARARRLEPSQPRTGASSSPRPSESGSRPARAAWRRASSGGGSRQPLAWLH